MKDLYPKLIITAIFIILIVFSLSRWGKKPNVYEVNENTKRSINDTMETDTTLGINQHRAPAVELPIVDNGSLSIDENDIISAFIREEEQISKPITPQMESSAAVK